jgi:hypothetical protein
LPPLELPRHLARTLEIATALERSEGSPEALRRAEELEAYTLGWMPAIRVEQRATLAEPEARFFHHPLAWERLPRLRGAIERLYDFIRAAGADPLVALGASTAEGFFAERPTLAAILDRTCFGASMPLLYGHHADLESYAAELGSGEALEAAIDRRLAAPIAHELSHFARHREALEPPLMDESVSGWLGVLALPELCWPAEGEDNALLGAPWFAQVGEAVVRLYGLAPVVAAHAGARSWASVLGLDLRTALERVGWDAYRRAPGPAFLAGNAAPGAYLKLLYLGRAGVPLAEWDLARLDATPFADLPAPGPDPGDRAQLVHALRSMALSSSLQSGSWRTRAADPAEPVTIDAMRCEVRRPGQPAYLLAPAVAAGLRASGVTGFEVRLAGPQAAERTAASILARAGL